MHTFLLLPSPPSHNYKIMPEGEDPAAAPVEDAPAEVVEAAPIEPIGPETLAAHLKIAAAFRVFDHENNNTVDVR